jgi:hypothetical protein
VWAACPGIDLPYEFFSQQNFTKTGAPTLAGTSKYGYCYNDNASATASLQQQRIPTKLKTITDKHTILAVVKPTSTGAGSKYIFTSMFSGSWAVPYFNLSLFGNAGKLLSQCSYGATSTQIFWSTINHFAVNTPAIVAMTRNGTAVNTWLNGKWMEAIVATSANPIYWERYRDVIGACLQGVNPAFQWLGDIIAVYIWNRDLSHSEISLISAFPFILFDDRYVLRG